MENIELAARRHQMGESLAVLSSAGPRPYCENGIGYWIAMSGVASPDANVALVDVNDPQVRDHVLRVVDAVSLPTTLVLAGEALEMDLGDAWRHQGDMPLMAISLSATEVSHDSRVRVATAHDVETVSELLASAYGIGHDESDAVAAFVHRERDDGTIWLLEDESRSVATVFTAVIDDAVCVWSLATPARYARHGYARALLADVLAHARDGGADVGLLGATPAGESLYRRAGWTTIETWRMFALTE
ncbi:MAG: GNAT family N-acetyltransferase [Acidobacteriota bacterium]|nr:GNAT family N-acetyltransferase [Acidobacteriota bacterium]